jgi:cytochrome c553
MTTAWGFVLSLTAAMTASPGRAEGNRALGEYLASECVTCHQLTGRFQGIPPIVGWPVASFIEIMDEYRKKQRENPIMQTIAGRFSDNEIAALAVYFGSLKSASEIDKTKSQQQRGRK